MAGETTTSVQLAQADEAAHEDAGHEVMVDEHGVVTEDHGETLHTATEAHAEEHGGVFPPFDPSTFGSQLLWLAITFGALYLLMSRVALPRIGEILEVRRDRIESDLTEADRLRKKTDQAIEAYETDLAEARGKAHAIAEETRQGIKTETGAARTKAETELAKKMAAAEARILETKNEALANVDSIAAQTAGTIVGKLADKVTAKEARDAVAEVVKG